MIDNIARKHGHTVLRTPPYHPELQPIETCWAIVKNHVARHNDRTMKKVKILLEEGFAKVTAKTCQKLIKKLIAKKTLFGKKIQKNRFKTVRSQMKSTIVDRKKLPNQHIHQARKGAVRLHNSLVAGN